MTATILSCIVTFIFAALAATFITSMVFTMIEDRKQAKATLKEVT